MTHRPGSARSRWVCLGSHAGVIWLAAGNFRFRSTHGAAGMEAHGPILALIGARSGREPLTAPLASSGGQAMRWGTARDDADQVEQDPLKCRRPGCVPPIARLANVSKVMGFHDGPAACRLSVQRRHKLFERLAGSHVPAAIPVLAPRVGDRAAFEAPLQPAQLVMGNMLSSSIGVQPDGSRLRRSSPPGMASSLLTSRERK